MAASVKQHFFLTEAEDTDLRAMFLECIEIHHGEASLAQLATMFCRSHFAGLASIFADCYDEFIEVWQLARPLVLRRYLLKHHQTFTISGIQVSSPHGKTIPKEILETIWYLKSFVLDRFSGIVKLSSLVEALLEDPAFANSVLGRVVGTTLDEVKKFVTACFSVFKVDLNTDTIYVVGSMKTLVNPIAENDVDKILTKLHIKPRKISELVKRFDSQNPATMRSAISSMYGFLSLFPFVFEVKKDSDGLDTLVFALQKHENGLLYKSLDEISRGKDISCPTIKESFQFCLKLLRKNWGRMDLGSQLDNFTNLRGDLRHLSGAIGSDRLDVVNFLSVFPSFFSVEKGRVILVDTNENSVPDGLLKLAREPYAEQFKDAEAADETGNCDTTENFTSQAVASRKRSEKPNEVAADNEERITDKIVEICVQTMKCAGGLVPNQQLTLEELTEKCANCVLDMYARKLDKPLVSFLEKFPKIFYLTPERLGLVLTEIINDEKSRLRSSKFRGFAQFLASDIATYSGLLAIKTISDHTKNVSACTFIDANVIKGNVASIAAFLASFPSLFWLERNLVHVNPGWWDILWPPGNATDNTPGTNSILEASTKVVSESGENGAHAQVGEDTRAGTLNANPTAKAAVVKACLHSLKRFGGIMSTKWLLIRVRHSGELEVILKCPQLRAEKCLLEVLLGHPEVFQLTPDQAGVVLTELLSRQNERLQTSQDLLKVVVSKLVAAEGIPLPVAAVSRCICLSRELTADEFRRANVPREDSGCLGAFLLSFPSVFVFESNTYSGRVSLKRGWRETLNSAGVRLMSRLSAQPSRSPDPQKKPTDEDINTHNERFEFCIDILERQGGTTSLDALVTEFQHSQDRRVDWPAKWLGLQRQFSALLLRHPFHFLLTADRRGIVLRNIISKERERLNSPLLKDFVTHTAVDLANDGGSLPIEILSHHLLRLSDDTFRKANVFKGDCGSLEAFLASFPSVFCFDKTGDVVGLTTSWLSVSNGAARTELEECSSDSQERVVLSDGFQTPTNRRRLFSEVTRDQNQTEQVVLASGLTAAEENKRQESPSCPADASCSLAISLSDVPAPSLPDCKRLCFSKEGLVEYLDFTLHQNAGPSAECAVEVGEQEHQMESLREDEGRLYLQMFPPTIQTEIEEYVVGDVVIDVVMNTGTRPELRYMDPNDPTQTVSKQITRGLVTHRVVKDVLKAPCLGPMSSDNRCGIEGTLHQISVMKNRKGKSCGLAARYGRAMYGCVTDMVYDLVCSRRSVLVVGEPEVGKTTVLREFARVLNDELGKRVLIVDTSNEIAGEGTIPHIAVGGARRLMVHPRESQHLIMAEGFRNHNPEVIVVDEITSEKEAEAARLITQRGVHLIASTHAQRFEELVTNKTLWSLIGGLRRVCPSTDQKKEGTCDDTSYERLGPTTFGALIEVQKRDCWVVHLDLQASIDSALLRQPVRVEIRERIYKDGMKMVQATPHAISTTALQVTFI